MVNSWVEFETTSGDKRLIRVSAITHIIEHKHNVTGVKVNGDFHAIWVAAGYNEVVRLMEKAS